MKLPVQAAAVVRVGLAWPSRGSSVLASSAAPSGSPLWLGCPDCPNPCERNEHLLCTCDTGTNTCCSGGQGCFADALGACVCKN